MNNQIITPTTTTIVDEALTQAKGRFSAGLEAAGMTVTYPLSEAAAREESMITASLNAARTGEDATTVLVPGMEPALTPALTAWGTIPNQDRIPQLVNLPHTDLGFAIRLATLFEGLLAYAVDAKGFGRWYKYDGVKWSEDVSGLLATNAARALSFSLIDLEGRLLVAEDRRWQKIQRTITRKSVDPADFEDLADAHEEANKISGEILKAFTTWATKLQDGQGHFDSAIKNATALMTISDKLFDADPYSINTPAGYVNIKTLTVEPHRADHYCTKVTSGNYIPGYRHPDVDKLIEHLEANGEGLALFFQRIAGLGLLGVPGGIFLYIEGVAGIGKSTLQEGRISAMGDYAGFISAEAFCGAGNGEGPRPAMHAMRGLRSSLSDEAAGAGKSRGGINMEIVKSIATGGVVPTRTMHEKSMTYWNSQSTHNFVGNKRMKIDTSDLGVKRRLIAINLTVGFLGEPDMTLDVRVRDGHQGQHDALMTWALEGARDFIAEGMGKPALRITKQIEEHTRTYIESEDSLSEFIDEWVEFVDKDDADYMPLSRTVWGMIHAEHASNLGEQGTTKMQLKEFLQELTARGVEWSGSTTATWDGSFTKGRLGLGAKLKHYSGVDLASKYKSIHRVQNGHFLPGGEGAKALEAAAVAAPVEAAPISAKPTDAPAPEAEPEIFFGLPESFNEPDEGHDEFELSA